MNFEHEVGDLYSQFKWRENFIPVSAKVIEVNARGTASALTLALALMLKDRNPKIKIAAGGPFKHSPLLSFRCSGSLGQPPPYTYFDGVALLSENADFIESKESFEALFWYRDPPSGGNDLTVSTYENSLEYFDASPGSPLWKALHNGNWKDSPVEDLFETVFENVTFPEGENPTPIPSVMPRSLNASVPEMLLADEILLMPGLFNTRFHDEFNRERMVTFFRKTLNSAKAKETLLTLIKDDGHNGNLLSHIVTSNLIS